MKDITDVPYVEVEHQPKPHPKRPRTTWASAFAGTACLITAGLMVFITLIAASGEFWKVAPITAIAAYCCWHTAIRFFWEMMR